MQQAYQAIRVVSEAQTIRVGLSGDPDELMLRELCTVCASLSGGSSGGIKAIVLDFSGGGNLPTRETGKKDGVEGAHTDASKDAHKEAINRNPTIVERACEAMRGVAQPVLGVARVTLSPVASKLLLAADFTLVAEDAMLFITGKGEEAQDNHVSGANAARLRYVTWSAARGDITKEMERILNMLREKSAVALRFAKASTRLGQHEQTTHLETLKRINMLYLGELMRSQDAAEGLRAFLEKRKPHWHNS